MDIAPIHATAPRPTADLRPSADAAALARDPTPHAPLGVPAVPPTSPAQIAAVTQAVLNGTKVRPPTPVLKPYGIETLPNLPRDMRARSGQTGG